MARYRFGVFEVDAASGELTRAGRRLHLAPQPAHALVVLLERAGTVVSRDELRRALWDDTTFVEFDQSLTFVVSRIRIALGDDARSSRFLETLPRRGYRFVAPVERFEAAEERPPAPAPPEIRASPPSAWPRRTAIAALAALLAASTPTLVPRHEPSSEARSAFRRGQALAGSGQRRQSLASLREATRLDPAFAEAHFAIASIYAELAEAGELAPADAFPIARAEAERALALEEVADSHLVRGTALFLYDWDREEARRAFERAVMLEPRANLPLVAYARLLSASGEHRAAMEAIGRAEALNPSCDIVVHEAGWVLYRARRYVEAIRKFERSAELGPPRFTDEVSWRKLNRFRILLVHLQMGSRDAAGEDARAIAQLAGAAPAVMAALRAAPPEEALRRVLRTSVRLLSQHAEREYVSPVRRAELHAALGEDDEALRWLVQAARDRAPALASSIADPIFDGLRARPAFQWIADRVAGGSGPRPSLVAEARSSAVSLSPAR
ncbi:MAG TPA: winged helix-turn-helix domain-containing protein [Vicinamibacteria bacterium]|nr:winged helix-turn-helix domain-containing protein [Vicinamibacteria bacterium]